MSHHRVFNGCLLCIYRTGHILGAMGRTHMNEYTHTHNLRIIFRSWGEETSVDTQRNFTKETEHVLGAG